MFDFLKASGLRCVGEHAIDFSYFFTQEVYKVTFRESRTYAVHVTKF